MSIERLCVLFSRMELNDSDELDHLRKNGPVDEATCRGWILQLTKALAYLHRKRIVHRDLKPENILVYSDEQLKLSDFGFACTCQPDELSTSFCGTKAFKAPELLQTRDYDPFKADVWALGIVCYILLTDTFPFDIAKDISQILEKMRSQNYQFPSRLAIIVSSREAINTILAFDPSDRPTIFDVSNLSWITHHLNARMTAQINKKSHTEKRYTRKFYHDYAFGLERYM
ncbi:hypothetical protein niasHS_005035 [Heterodera schachtii]|uniref:Protein kinase domain-containing protein n=1 Tax=Heterodera schachtii TaxID=97005 RepID=A0ABD2JKH8_HETSC